MLFDRKEGVKGRRFILLLTLYLLLQVLIRVVVTGNAELDEAEQLVWGQQFSLGYGAELPLYTWLQALLFSLFGTNIFAVSLLRNLLLFVIYLFTYLNAREITGSERCALAAAASLFLIPLISWESQRILVTMVLATALTAVSLFLFLRMLRTGLLRYYLLFGLAAGFGLLTKYNFAIFLVALLLSALSLRTFHNRLADWKVLATVAGFFLVTAAPFSWILSHSGAAMAKTGKLHRGGDAGLLQGYFAGLGTLTKAVAAFHAFLIPVYLLNFARSPRSEDLSGQDRDRRKLVGRTVLLAIFICIVMVLFFRVTFFKARWLLPLLYPVPIYLVAVVQERLGHRPFRRLLVCSGVVAGVIMLALPGRIVLARYAGSYSRMNYPYDQLAGQLRSAGFRGGIIVAENHQLGGNLKLRFPESRVVVAGFGPLPAANDQQLLIVWDAVRSGGVPRSLSPVVASLPASANGYIRQAEAPANYVPQRTERLAYIISEPAPQAPGSRMDR